MKKTQVKRVLALALAAAMLLAAAPEVDAAQTGRAFPVVGAGAFMEGPAASVKPGEPLTDVTEAQAAAFERSLEVESLGVTGDETDYAKRAKQKAQAIVSLYQANSVQYAVMQNGELLLSDAYGTDDSKKKTKVTTDSMYCVASISKMFATTAVMQLVEEEKIDLDQPVTAYVPEFKMKDARYKDITVRMLLNHSSGILGGDLSSAVLFGDSDTAYHDNLLKKLAGQSLKADPGAYSVYCNDGFILAEIVVEHVSGQTFTDYLQEHVFTPLGLTSTKTAVQVTEKDPVAGAYVTKKSAKLPIEYFNAIGTGGVYSSAEDLCRFGMTFTKDQGKLLSKESVAATMVEEGRKGQWCEEYTGAINYGLGWDTVNTYPFADYGITAMEKGGDSLFYHGELVVLPEQNLSVAVLTSGASSSHDAIFAQYLAKELLKEQGVLTDEKMEGVVSKYETNKQAVPAELKTYEGYYTSMGSGYKVKLTKNGLKLTALLNPDEAMEFTYSGDGWFVFRGGVQAMRFMTQNNLKYLMVGSYSTLPGIGTSFAYTYFGQKTASKNLPKAVKKAWNKRDDKIYFYLTEKYSSAFYEKSAVIVGVDMDMCQPGYFMNDRIVDANTAVEFIDIPIQMSRDARNFSFETDKNGVEYLVSEGIYAISEDGLKNLSTKSSFTVAISKKTGYAKWFKISKKNAGKKLTVKLPKNKGCTVAVYDKNGQLKLNSYVSGKTSVKLPKDGFIVFAGEKGASFNVKIK